MRGRPGPTAGRSPGPGRRKRSRQEHPDQNSGGAVRPDAGTIEIDGRPVHIRGPLAAQQAGISIIYQEFNLVPALTAGEHLPGPRAGTIQLASDFSRAPPQPRAVRPDRGRDRSRNTLPRPDRGPATGGGNRQGPVPPGADRGHGRTQRGVVSPGTEHLLAVIRELQAQGIGLIYISHRLSEVFEIADRVMVLRDAPTSARNPLPR